MTDEHLQIAALYIEVASILTHIFKKIIRFGQIFKNAYILLRNCFPIVISHL